MAKYDSVLSELKNLLPNSKTILIALPSQASIDQLASGLSLFLTLEAGGKQVSVVCDDSMVAGQGYLFGIDHVQKNMPTTDGGNLTLTLEGVAASDNTVPALEKLDWFAENSNLNLVFHVLPGQQFQPVRIVPKHQGAGFNLIFTIGAVNLNALGNVYSANSQVFSGTHIINIDIQQANTGFGQTNIVDPNASSISEVMSNVISDLGLILDGDSASNLLAGIFESTSNLTDGKSGAETFMAVANCLRAGGKKPGSTASQPQSASQIQPAQTIQQLQSQPQPAFDWSALMPQDSPITPKEAPQEFAVPPVVSSDAGDDSQASPEERPVEEGVISETVEPEWLTPKIFKGSSLG